MRADFLHRAAENRDLARAIGEHDVIVSPMQPDELRKAIEKPADHAGGDFEPGLVDEYVLANNDLPDRFATEAERWGEHYERVAATAKNHAQLFDPAANPVADPNPWPVDWASEPAKGHD